MVMERDKLVESKAKATGLGDVKVTWVKVAGPSVMNDGVVSGALHFIAVGAPSLITLWDKTRSNVGVKGVSAMTTYPLYLNVRNPNVKSMGRVGRVGSPYFESSTTPMISYSPVMLGSGPKCIPMGCLRSPTARPVSMRISPLHPFTNKK